MKPIKENSTTCNFKNLLIFPLLFNKVCVEMQLSCDFCYVPPSRRIFILGPSHHVPLSRCALSSVDIYRTPLYDLRIDQKSKYIEI